MTLAEQMQSMMDELRAIKHLNKSLKFDMDSEVTHNGARKIANLISMIDNLRVPDIVVAFEEVSSANDFNNEQGGLA